MTVRFENRLNKNRIKFQTLNPVWDNEKMDALNVFEMIELLNKQHDENELLKSIFKDILLSVSKTTIPDVSELTVGFPAIYYNMFKGIILEEKKLHSIDLLKLIQTKYDKYNNYFESGHGLNTNKSIGAWEDYYKKEALKELLDEAITMKEGHKL